MSRVKIPESFNDKKIYWLTLIPFNAFTYGVWQIIVFLSIIFNYIQNYPKINLRFIIGFFVLVLIIFFSGSFLSSEIVIQANLVNPENRTHGTIGEFSSIGATNYSAAFRFLTYIIIVFIMSKVYISETTLKFSLNLCVMSFIFSMMFVLILLSYDSGYSILKSAARQVAGEGNFLVSDSFGFRISGGFIEPSMMSIFMGTVLGILFLLKKSFFESFSIFLILISIFVFSRSLASIVTFAGVLMVARAPKWLLFSIFLIALVLIPIFKELFNSFFLFRSINERLFIANFTDLELKHFLFGVGFGNIYSHIPLLNQVLQYGMVGFITFFLMLNLEFRSIMAYFLISFIAPQLWFPFHFICLGLFLIYIRNSNIAVRKI